MTLKGSSSISYNNKVDLNGDFLTYYGGETDYLAHDDGSRDFPLANKILDVQTVQDPRINPETMPNTLLFNPQMATERGKDYFSNNKFFKLYNSITNNSTMNFNGGSLKVYLVEIKLPFKIRLLVTVEHFPTKINFHFTKIRFKTHLKNLQIL